MAKTLQSFREWAISAGSVSNPTNNPDNYYTGECVSLVQQYLAQVFDIPYAARGNAKDFVPPTFVRVSGAIKSGDIIRYGAGYGGGYGHIGLIDDDGKFLDQNGVVARRVGRRDTPFAYIEGIYRPTRGFVNKTPVSTVGSRIAKRGTAKVLVDALNVRNEPKTNGAVVAVYNKNQSFNYDSYIITNGYVWLSYISSTGVRRYVAEGPYDGDRNNIYVKGGIS